MSHALGAVPPRRMSSTTTTKHLADRNYLHRWNEAPGATLLVVDPQVEEEPLRTEMSARGVHVTWCGSTVDGLIEFGRTHPNAVVIAPEADGIAATEFVETIRRHGAPFVIAALATPDAAEAGPLLLAGAGAAVTRPYTAETLEGVLQQSNHALDDHARVSFGPIELDARAYTVSVDGQRLSDLPLKEFEMLRVLMYRAPDVLSDDELRASLWGSENGGPTDNTLAVHAGRLRTRLQGVASIRRVRGLGYALSLG